LEVLTMKDSALIAGVVSASLTVVVFTFVGDLPPLKRIAAGAAAGIVASAIVMAPELLRPEWKTTLLTKSGGLLSRVDVAQRKLSSLGEREQALVLALGKLGSEIESVTSRGIALKGQGASNHGEWFATVAAGLTLVENYVVLRSLPDAPDDVAVDDVAGLVSGLIQQAKGVKSDQVSDQLIALQAQLEMLQQYSDEV
jgi:hypothetical protein